MTQSKQPAKKANVWTDEERAAMQESARERSRRPVAARRTSATTASTRSAPRSPTCRTSDRAMAERIHALVTGQRPVLVPKTYYGMPAYAKDGKVICFFQPASKFKVRYATFGFQPDATLDDGDMWPVAFAVTS